MMRILRFARRYALAALGSLWALTVGVASRSGRRLLGEISESFVECWKDVFIRRVPSVGPSTLLNADEVELVELPMADGNVTQFELFVIVNMVRRFKPMRLFEIGTFDGRTTLNMSINAPEGATVFTLDLPQGATARDVALQHRAEDDTYVVEGQRRSRLAKERIRHPAGAAIVRLFGDSARFDYGPYEGTIDFVFVDGAHSYEYVLNDSEAALRLLRNGKGVILWHDFTNVDDVARALRTFRAGHRQVTIKRIVDTKLAYAVLEGGSLIKADK